MENILHEIDSNKTVSTEVLSAKINKILVIEHIKNNQFSMQDAFHYHLADNKTLTTLWFNSNKDH